MIDSVAGPSDYIAHNPTPPFPGDPSPVPPQPAGPEPIPPAPGDPLPPDHNPIIDSPAGS